MTKADVEKARLNKEQKRTLAEDAKNEYARALVKCNEQQRNHHTKLVPDILSRYQTEFLASSDKYCSTVQSYCQVEEKFRPLMTSCLGDIQHKAKAINGKEDANLIVDEFKTGYHPPEDIQFEGKYTANRAFFQFFNLIFDIFRYRATRGQSERSKDFGWTFQPSQKGP